MSVVSSSVGERLDQRRDQDSLGRPVELARRRAEAVELAELVLGPLLAELLDPRPDRGLCAGRIARRLARASSASRASIAEPASVAVSWSVAAVVGSTEFPSVAGVGEHHRTPMAPAYAARSRQPHRELLRHHPDLLRQRRAAPRPRVLDDRRRRARPPHAPARRGRVLPHRHRRARRAGRAGGRARGRHPAGARRPQRAAVRAADAERSRPRTTSSSAPPTASTWPRSRRSCSASTTTATSTRASTRAGTARAAPTSRPSPSSARTTPARSTRSRSIASARRTGSFASRPSRSRSSASTPSGPTSSSPSSRRNEALSFITQGLQDVSLSRPKLSWGVPLPWDPEQVMYVWFDALLNYVTALSLRARGRGPDRALLARLPRDRQGHPQVPRRLLAGVPARRRATRCRGGCSSTATC